MRAVVIKRLIGVLAAAWVAGADAAYRPAGADGVATPQGGGALYTFEAPDFALGELAGQQGWTTEWSGDDWTIDASHPYAGSQHLRSQVSFDGLSSAAFGPTLMDVGTSAFSVATAQIAVHNFGTGSNAVFSPLSAAANDYSPAGPLPVTRVRIKADGSIDALQPDFVWAATTGVIADTDYHEVRVVADNTGTNTIRICLDGSSIFTGTNMAAVTGTASFIDTIWLQSSMDTGSIGSTADFDDMRIADADSGGCGGTPDAWNFDGVAAPALPTGWTSDAAGAGEAWITQADVADTAPNAAYAPDHDSAGEASLYSATVTVDPAGAQLSFRHRWNTEQDGDGGVLEISIGGGAFVGIVEAGGSFVEGGYNGSLASPDNPIGPRDAWTGQQDSFVTTTVNLPAAAAGQPAQFRWRLGSDASGEPQAPNGWWVDTAALRAAPAPTYPTAQVGPDALDFTLDSGASDSGILTIANTGGGVLTFTIPGAAETTPRPHSPASAGPPRAGSFGHSRNMATGLRGRAVPLGTGAGIDIAQMTDNAPQAQNSIACGTPGVSTSATSWWRRFYFDEHAAVGASTTINSVTIASETGPSLPVTVNVYTIAHDVAVDTVPTSQLTLIGTGSGTVGGEMTTTTIAIPSASVDDTIGKDLVVEYHVDGTDDGAFYPGGNPSPQTHATLMSSESCGQPEPTDAAVLGFPDFHLIMVVNLSQVALPAECSALSAAPWLSATPSSGALAGGDSTDVTLSVDASDLAEGDYSAVLCVATNDAATPVIQVPVSLSVNAAPIEDAIFGDGFDGKP